MSSALWELKKTGRLKEFAQVFSAIFTADKDLLQALKDAAVGEDHVLLHTYVTNVHVENTAAAYLKYSQKRLTL